MASYNPPTEELPIFEPSVFIQNSDIPLTATNAKNVHLTNEGLQNSGCFIPFSIIATGNQPLKTNTYLRYNPNTEIFNVGYISTTGTITSGSFMTANGTLTANNGLTMGGATNITLGSGATAPTAGTQLGGATTGTFITPTLAFSVDKVIATLTIPQSGTYIIFFSFQIFYTTLPSVSFISVNTGSSGGTPNIGYSPTVVNSGEGLVNGSFPLIVPTGTAGTVQLKYFLTGTINSITKTLFTAIRIA